jgi:ribonuclease R
MKRNKASAVRQKRSMKMLEDAVRGIFQNHPTRIFNHKQITKLVRQHEPVLASQLLYEDDREANRQIMVSVLEQLCESDDIREVDTGRYRVVPKEMFLEGYIEITSSGAGYVMNENHEEDIYISPYNTGFALDGDKVRIVLLAGKQGKRREGEVVSVIQRAREEFAGTLKVQHNHSYIIPDSPRVNIEIAVQKKHLNKARHGDKVVVKVTRWPDDAQHAEGEVTEVLGRPGDNDAEMNAILVEYGFPTHFPKNVEKEAAAIPDNITVSEIRKRKDLRKVTTFTIDPVDAKDFDDALSVRSSRDGVYEIGIHIADVSHYVKEGSIMDEEAFSRATSIYLVDRVIPMLPEKLSNMVCSLRPREDKLCFSAIFEIDNDAKVLSEWYGRTVIHSDHRFTYEEAQQIIETGEGVLSEEVLLLDTLAKKMRTERFSKGAISFDREEVKFHLDEKGHPIGVYTKQNRDSNKLIEEFMLLANRKVAEFIGKRSAGKATKGKTSKPPVFVYRIHDSPVPDKLRTFSGFAGKFGYQVKTSGDSEIARSINKLLLDVRGKAEQNIIEQLAIRTMSKAVYTTENIGHYGLAFDFYTHFTSPIRRYPDVLVHRLLDHYMKKGLSVPQDEYEDMCQHSTDMEIKASEAERASIKYKQVQYLEDKKGEVFRGIISGVTEWGVYVELEGNKCEGMVRLRDIANDYYEFDEDNYALVGHRTGNTFRLGDEVEVKIKRTDLERKQIDFIFTNDEPKAFAGSPRRLGQNRSGGRKQGKNKKGKRR